MTNREKARDYVSYTRTTCPDRRKHTPGGPAGFNEWHAWAERKDKTHKQLVCPTCGLYVIWERKPKEPTA